VSANATSIQPDRRMIRLHRSARMETLLEALVETLKCTPADLEETLRGEVIAVPNRGMGRWLSMSLAQRVGICAGVSLPFPRRMLQQALREILGEEGCPHPGWEPAALAFHVLNALDSLLAEPEFEPIRGYLESTGASEEVIDRRRVLLARRISVTFDRYITQRPQLARDWSAGKLGEDPDWQPVLWRAIQESIGGPHLAACALQIQQSGHLERPTDTRLPARLHLFGVTSIPPLFLELLRTMTTWWEVHMHVLAPSDVYWAGLQTRLEKQQDIRAQIADESFDATRLEGMDNPFKVPGNALLESYGALSRDMQLMLEGSSAETPYMEAMSLSEMEAPTTLLGTLQYDIHHYIGRGDGADGVGEPPVLVGADDRSVQVHACHGPTRQVEVLRDVLVGLLNEDSSLEPRDIVVMTPDIEAYAPLIEAVFADGAEERVDPVTQASSYGEEGFPKLPFTIADRSQARENRSAEAVLSLLGLASGAVKASAVLDFLALDPVRRRFGLDDAADELIRAWVKGSGIRWGLDASHRVRRGQPEEDAFTWRFGLDRLLLGVAMDEGPLRSFGGVVPWDSAALGDREVLGRFIAFTEALMASIHELVQPHDAIGWRSVIGRAMGRLLVADDDSVHAQQQVRTALDELVGHAEAVQMDRSLSLDAVECILRERIELQGGPSGFLGGRITCCAMVPMRSIPFRVVCLLGMDDGAFPRQGGRLGFDRVAQSPRLGDTDPRKEDRHLFLEAILSARDRLIITHTGRSRKDNKLREPAVPVCDLLDVLERSVRLSGAPDTSIRSHVVQNHPLHGFSASNYGPDPVSFDRRGIVGAEQLRAPREGPPAFFPTPLPAQESLESAEPLDPEALVRFLANPVRELMKGHLQVSVGVKREEVSDREPLELDGLERWGVGERLLHQESSDTLKTMLHGEGLLPLGAPGELVFSEIQESVERMRAHVEALGGGQSESREVDCVIEGTRLVGSISGVCSDALVHGRFGSARAEDRLRLWLHQALLTVMEPERSIDAFFVGSPDKKNRIKPVEMPARDGEPEERQAHAREAIAGMLRLYRMGHVSPLPFLLESARGYLEVFKKAGVDPDHPPAAILKKALKAAQTPLKGGWDAGMEAHAERVFGASWVLTPESRGPGAGPAGPTFHEAAQDIWGPVMEATR